MYIAASTAKKRQGRWGGGGGGGGLSETKYLAQSCMCSVTRDNDLFFKLHVSNIITHACGLILFFHVHFILLQRTCNVLQFIALIRKCNFCIHFCY